MTLLEHEVATTHASGNGGGPVEVVYENNALGENQSARVDKSDSIDD